jgi:predicted methyltransferase
MLCRMKGRVLAGGAAALFFISSCAGQTARPVAPVADDRWAQRDAWQRPAEVMDALNVKQGSVVADVGCNDGYFTFHLAQRVGVQGKVYAEDIEYKPLSKLSARAFKEHLPQIEIVLGAKDDPHLPVAALDAVLVVDAYHEMEQFDAMLQGMFRSLKAGGLLGIIDRKADAGQPRKYYLEHHRIPEGLVREDAARNGFQLVRQEAGFTVKGDSGDYFFLVFRKP